jgi:hypothetical protein
VTMRMRTDAANNASNENFFPIFLPPRLFDKGNILLPPGSFARVRCVVPLRPG